MSAAEPKSGVVRLNKFLAERGVDSRRKCDELIAEGKVSVNDRTVTELGTKIDTTRDTVEVAGFVFRPDEVPRKRYYLLNKPPGVVCTSERRELRPRAIDLISDRDKGRIFTVGRLDEESKGLVLLTNDGDFAHRIMHPRFEVPKTYAVKVRGPVDDEALQKVRQGVHLSEGRTGGARVLVRKRTRDYTHVLVTLLEGKNREVRRVFARVGAKISELKRVRIGNLTDKGLKVGTWRPLLRAEVRDLLELSEGRGAGAADTEGELRVTSRTVAKGKDAASSGQARGGRGAGKPGGRAAGAPKVGAGRSPGGRKRGAGAGRADGKGSAAGQARGPRAGGASKTLRGAKASAHGPRASGGPRAGQGRSRRGDPKR